MPTLVHVSAHVLRFPDRCACCLGPADATLRAAHTRVTGVKIVREKMHSWDFPYCGRCIEHAEAVAEIRRIRGRISPAVLWGGISALFALSAAVFFFGGAVHPVLATLLWLICGSVPAVLFACIVCPPAHRRFKKRQAEDIEAARSRLNPRASTARDAVEYHGWYGSVHTFLFRNDRFAELFVRRNHSKVLSVNRG